MHIFFPEHSSALVPVIPVELVNASSLYSYDSSIAVDKVDNDRQFQNMENSIMFNILSD